MNREDLSGGATLRRGIGQIMTKLWQFACTFLRIAVAKTNDKFAHPVLVALAGGMLALAATPGASSAAEALPVRMPPGVAPISYVLELRVDPAEESFQGSVTIQLTFAERTRRFWLHAQGLMVSSARLAPSRGATVDAHLTQMSTDGTALVSLDSEVPSGRATLTVQYSGQFNPGLEGLYVGDVAGVRYAVTQMEPLGARRVLPSFDEPRFKTPFTLTVIAPDGMAVVANSPQTRTEPAGGGFTRHRFTTTPPLPTYLLAVAVGPYDIVDGPEVSPNSVRRLPLTVRGVAPRGQSPDLATSLADTARLIPYHEQYFGIAYPYAKLDLIAAPAFAAGAEENAGAIVFRAGRLLVSSSTPRAQWRDYFITLAHEIAHHWVGNHVTPPWWDDVWLKEAFATWFQHKAAHTAAPAAAFDRATILGALAAMELDSLAGTRRIREPVKRNEDVSGVYDSITYLKGAGVLAMLERYVGEERFRAGVRSYLSTYGSRTATADEFFRALAHGSGEAKLVDSLRTFVDQPYVPWLHVDVDCSEPSRPILRVAQSPYRPLGSAIQTRSNWLIPASFRYEADGRVAEAHALLEHARTDVALATDRCPRWVLPNAGGAGYWRFSLNEIAWQPLIDALPALEPGEQLVTLDSLAAAFRAGKVSARTYLAGVRAGLNVEAWDVALFAARVLADALPAQALSDSADTKLKAHLRTLLGQRMRRLSATPQGKDGRLLRAELARILVMRADDAQIIAQLGADAAKGDFALLDSEPDLRAPIVAAAVKGTNGQLPPGFLQAVASEADQSKRADMLVGAAAGVSPDGAAPLLAAVSKREVPSQELPRVLDQLMRNDSTRRQVWTWLKAHAELVGDQYPVLIKASAPELGRYFCDLKAIEEVQSLFESHAATFPGYERKLALTVEVIQLCAALKGARASELSMALSQ